MHIVVDVRKAFDSGIGTYIRQVVPGVVKALGGCTFTLLVPAIDGDTVSHRLWDGVNARCHAIGAKPLGLSEQWQLRRVLRALTPVDYFWATSLAHAMGGKTPLIATVHDVVQLALDGREGSSIGKRAAARLYLESIRLKADLLLFNSQFTRSEFTNRLSEPRCPWAVTPLGVDASWFEDALPDRSGAGIRPYLICITSWRPHKNLSLLLRAFAIVRDRLPYDLVLVGADAERGAAHAAELGSRVRWHRFVPQALLKAWVRGADAMVLPSLYEGFGLPALEALSTGCPVVVSDIGAFREVCDEEAIYFDPRQVDSLARALVSLTRMGNEEIEARRQRGIKRARSFDWRATIDSTARAIESTMLR